MRPLNDVAYPIHDLLRRRWSPRAFADRPVEPDKLRRLLEAARWAPSSFNEQPWSYIVATREDPAEYARLLGCLVEQNQRWAKSAPVLMLSVATLAFARNGKPNRHALHDTGMATAQLIIQALSFDLYVHQMAGFDVAKARATYGLPDTVEPVAGIALGYLGDPAILPDDLRAREEAAGTRKSQAEFVFTGAWGRAAELGTP